MAFSGQSLTSLAQMLLYISYQASSRLPSRYMISPKTWRSARGDLSEKRICFGCSRMARFQRRLRECRAFSWKVNAHRLGSSQQFFRMLPPAMCSHQSTGSLMTERLNRERRVLFPAPRLPQMEITPDINVIKPLNCESNQTAHLNYKNRQQTYSNLPLHPYIHPFYIHFPNLPQLPIHTLMQNVLTCTSTSLTDIL